MEWFRREQRCPLCRDDAGISSQNQQRTFRSYRHDKGKVQLVRKICKNNAAPKYLHQLLKRLDTLHDKLKHTKHNREFLDSMST